MPYTAAGDITVNIRASDVFHTLRVGNESAVLFASVILSAYFIFPSYTRGKKNAAFRLRESKNSSVAVATPSRSTERDKGEK